MGSSTPGLHGLPEHFPVFPLEGALLLPRGRLPLNIFEARYLALTEDALAAGRMFAMVQPDPGGATLATGPGLYRVGCLGRLSAFSETDDGRYMITLTGTIRFALAEELPMVRGYRRVRGDFSAYAADLSPPGAMQFDRDALLGALRQYFHRRGFQANWDAIGQMDDDTFITTVSMVCPFEPVEKQALLEAPTSSDRAGVLLALLQMDRHDTASDRPRAS